MTIFYKAEINGIVISSEFSYQNIAYQVVCRDDGRLETNIYKLKSVVFSKDHSYLRGNNSNSVSKKKVTYGERDEGD